MDIPQRIRNTYPEPIISFVRRWTFFSKTCVATNTKIPAFSKAWCREIDYLIRDEVSTEYEWLSDAGYMLEKLKGNC